MKNNIKNILIVAVYALSSALISCSSEYTENDGHKHKESTENHSKEDGHDHGASSDNEKDHEQELHLTKEQITTIGLEFGDFSSIKVNDFIKATGTLGLPPNAYAAVSAKSEGIVVGALKFVEGNYIKKGQVIAFIENPAFIVKQQEYLESKAQLELKQLDLERQQSLVDANAGVTKNLQNTKAEVAILEAKTIGLSKHLSYLGISTEILTPNSISKQIAIKAPMSGFISNINIHNGMYVQPTVALMEIISDDHLHLELDVFEKDIANIKIGQLISYTVPALGATVFNGEVSVIGKEFNSQSKTVRIHGHIEGKKPMFLKDLFINAKIWLNDVTTQAIPEKSVIKDEDNTFVYVANNSNANEIEFKTIRVIAGATSNGYTAVKVLEEIPKGMKIVTKGAYYVYAQSKAGELEHDH